MAITAEGQLLQKPNDKGSVIALTTCTVASTLLIAALLYLFGISPVPLLLALGAVGLMWFASRHTVGCVGSFLAFMPFFPLCFLLAKFAGPSYIGKLEGIDRAVLLLLTALLFARNRVKLILPDYLLILAFSLATLRLPLDGSLLALAADFGFVIPYAAGRLIRLTANEETTWAKRAVWIMSAVSVLGLAEVLLLGEGPRTLLYFRVAADETVNGDALLGTFHASEFTGLRVSGTQFGPLQFGVLCMAILVIWWVYSRRPIPAILIGLAFIGSLARGAWMGTAVAIPLAAIGMGQTKRFFKYGIIALIVFIISIPILGIGAYLAANQSGSEDSAMAHQNSLIGGTQFVLTHPLGIGSANYGRQAMKSNPDAFYYEGGYFIFLAGYGIPISLCLLGFIATAMARAWRQRTRVGLVAVAMLAGFNVILIFVAEHDVFPVICWIWFPVGIAVTRSVRQDEQNLRAGSAPEPLPSI